MAATCGRAIRFRSVAAALVSLVAVATACQSHDSTEPPPPPAPTGPFAISPPAAFAGSTVMIHGAEFRTRGTGAVLTLGDTLASLTRVDDTTMSTRVPATLGGVVTPVLKLDGYQVPLPALTVYGYVELKKFDQSIAYDMYVWPRTGRAVVMGFTGFTDGLSFFDLDAGTVTTYPGFHFGNGIHGPGATYQDSIFAFRADDGTLETWRVLPTPTKIATYPGVGGCCDWEAAQLGPNKWITATKYTITTPADTVTTLQPQSIEMSPRHDRATIRAYGAAGPGFGTQLAAIPVFDAPSGQVAYLSPLQVSKGVDFSPDGELLAMVGGSQAFTDIKRIVLLRASTGAILGDTTIDRSVYAVSIDPARPLLYVGIVTGNRPTVLVLDRNTFHTVGEMQAPAFTSALTYPDWSVLALNSHNGLYFFWNGNGDPSPAWRFTLPPP